MPVTLIDDARLTQSASRNIRKTVMPNGLLVLTESMPHLRSVSMGAWIGSGSRDEARSQRNLALSSSTWCQGDDLPVGSTDCPRGRYDWRQSDAFTGKEMVCFNIKVLDENAAA
jgi:hypothetical protein